jgi:hypothetical protein
MAVGLQCVPGGGEDGLAAVGEQDVPAGALAAGDGLADSPGADDDDDLSRHELLLGQVGQPMRSARGQSTAPAEADIQYPIIAL